MTKKQKILLGILLPITILGGTGIGYGVYVLSKLNGGGGHYQQTALQLRLLKHQVQIF